jgi:TonB family protein
VIALVLTGMLAAFAAPDSLGTTPGPVGGVALPQAQAPRPGAPASAFVPPDTALRVPGTRLRFGYSAEQVLAKGPFSIVTIPPALGYTHRRGPLRWFGVETEATLYFFTGRLARVRVAAKDVPPHAVDYLVDELRRSRFHARWERDEPGLKLCDWDGAVHVRLEVRQGALLADLNPVPPAPPQKHAPPPARRDTVPMLPEILVLGRSAMTGAYPAPELREDIPRPERVYPLAARDAGVQGRVRVRALVDTSGIVTETQVVRSIAELDSAAIAWVRQVRFRPYVYGGRVVRFRVEVPVTYTLH